ncbi:MAG: alkaline phosphatase family protein [Marmoricola sp.]
MVRRIRPVILVAVGTLALLVPAAAFAGPAPRAVPAGSSGAAPPVGHVFVINIENKGFDRTWGPDSAAPYLAKTLRAEGVLLDQYYATAHNSQPNYVAQISGQGPNALMQADCPVYAGFIRLATLPPRQAVGLGCVFPASVGSLPRQMTAHGLSWKGYMDDMQRPCQHPAVGAVDPTQQATADHEYAVRHDPFMYFHSIIDSPSYCADHVVLLTDLATDLSSVATTPNLSYITPDLCDDGHDSPCADGRPGGLATVNAWMQQWVPRILSSPAFGQDGMLVITADESDGPESDSTACCGEGPGPNSLLPGILGPGGGRIGALVISRWTAPDTQSTTPYNHYSLLASLEEIFGLPRLGYASASGLDRFGLDVYNNGWQG